jgi:hypothetical protein
MNRTMAEDFRATKREKWATGAKCVPNHSSHNQLSGRFSAAERGDDVSKTPFFFFFFKSMFLTAMADSRGFDRRKGLPRYIAGVTFL